MADTTLYGLRLAQYLSLMLLAGLPWLQWLAGRIATRHATTPAWIAQATLRRWLLACVAVALLANAVELPLRTMRIMWLPLAELDAESLRWYALETAAGMAWLVRGALLVALGAWLLRPASRTRLAIRSFGLLACAALVTLIWNGHAGASTGLPGWIRLGIGGVHLIAGAAWLGAIAGFLILLAGRMSGAANADAGVRLYPLLHAFSASGSVLVALLLATGIVHYAWIQDWSLSPSTLTISTYGGWMLFKLVLFTGMLCLAAVHRWVLVPRMTTTGDTAALRRSLWLEAALAVLVVLAVAVLGTMSPHG